MRYKLLLLLSVILIVIVTFPIRAVDIGGEVEVVSYSLIGDSEYDTLLEEKLNLEMFLPETETTTAKFEVDIITDSETQSNHTRIKKLYLTRKYEQFNLTLGRQPISWMFGSLINPVDFNLGAETVNQESFAKNVDALEIYYPINWGSNITGVLSTGDGGKIKYGLRGRTTLGDYDLTANFVKERNQLQERIAVTAKGDLGPIGIYSAAGHYLEQSENILLLGADYSFYQEAHQIILQAEYIYDKVGMMDYLGGVFNNYSNLISKELGSELFAGTVSYSIDDFNTVKLTSLVHVDDTSLLLIPEYESQLVGNLDFNLRCGLLLGGTNEVFGPQSINDQDTLKGIFEVSLRYPF